MPAGILVVVAGNAPVSLLHGGPMQGWTRGLLVAVATAMLALSSVQASQPQQHTGTQGACCQPKVLPDEYSVLDNPTAGSDVGRELERARQYYLRGLAAIERRDTAKASKLFEAAMDVLNQLASTPGIERNEDYSDLAQSIIEDFETFIRPIDELEVHSPLFVMRDRLFQAVEIVQSPVAGAFSIAGGSLPTTVPLPQNEYVNNAIAFLTNTERGRTFFKKVLGRMNRFFPLFRRIAREEGLPEELIHLAIIESGLDPNAVSRAKAVGLWQFIQSTGELYQLRVTEWYDERRDPEKSTRAAMRHLRDLYQELGDWHLVLAAYNCGINCVRRAIKQSGLENPTYWQIRELLPRETRGYVPMYIAATLVAMQAEAYGFRKEDITPEPEWVYDTVTVTEPLSLSAAAQCAATTLDTIKALNPELVRNITPPHQHYTLRIPPGRTSEFTVRLAMLSPDERQPWINHSVHRGETLAQIAERYDVPLADIAEFNGISPRTRLRRGQLVRIPIAPSFSQSAPLALDDTTSTTSATTATPTATTAPPAVAATAASVPAPQFISHRVRRGETLAQIADDYGTSVAELRRINRLRRAQLVAGQVLKVPARSIASSASSPRPPLVRKVIHRVRRGESISTIAALYGVREADVIRWNPSLAGGILKAGDQLTIPLPPSAKGSDRATPRTVNRLPKWYVVRPGDTLYSIARRFGVDVAHILAKNKSLVPDQLRVGQRVRLQ